MERAAAAKEMRDAQDALREAQKAQDGMEKEVQFARMRVAIEAMVFHSRINGRDRKALASRLRGGSVRSIRLPLVTESMKQERLEDNLVARIVPFNTEVRSSLALFAQNAKIFVGTWH